MKRVTSIICLVLIVSAALACTSKEPAGLGSISDEVIELNWNNAVKDLYFPYDSIWERRDEPNARRTYTYARSEDRM